MTREHENKISCWHKYRNYPLFCKRDIRTLASEKEIWYCCDKTRNRQQPEKGQLERDSTCILVSICDKSGLSFFILSWVMCRLCQWNGSFAWCKNSFRAFMQIVAVVLKRCIKVIFFWEYSKLSQTWFFICLGFTHKKQRIVQVETPRVSGYTLLVFEYSSFTVKIAQTK